MIEPYESSLSNAWDSFVLDKSVNGNFLQTRRFLGYHPIGRFVDASAIFLDTKGNLRAVIPAAVIDDSQKKWLVSHPGSTYGGVVCDGKSLSAKRFQRIIDEIEDYALSLGCEGVDLRFPPSFLWDEGAPLVEYLLNLNDYRCFPELTTYIDLACYGDNTLKRFTQGKRTNVNNCIKRGLELTLLNNRNDCDVLHELLAKNLSKYNAKPVHTSDEMWDLFSNRLQGETELIGVSDCGRLVAGGWVFLFNNRGTVHTQYLCADEGYSKLSPMTFLYYSVIERYREIGYRFVSWGVSTEDSGRILNWGLTDSKESYGSLHDVQRRFVKHLK